MPYSVKIVVLDYYMSQPIPGLDVTYSEFRSTTINQVPVLRCFGSNENGQKICVHVHGVFPYLYIPYDGKGKPEELMYKLAISIDKTINIQFNQASSNAHHVYKISLVSGIPMYGYHAKKHQFFKIYLYNPNLVPKVGALFLNKNILEQVFQPHEIHLNFTLQFMIDYNLHGMSNMLLGNIKFRYNPDCSGNDIDKDLFLPHSVSKTSMCELEADILAENILNREEIISGNLAVNPGIAALWEDEKQRRRNKSEVSQLGDFLELKNMNVPPTKTHQVFQQALKERLAVLSTDKEVAKQPSPDASIYPAEVSDNLDIQNASCLDIHCSSSLELSLDDTFISNSQFLNISLPADEDTDKEAQEFMLILEQLAEEKIGEVEQEEGSMLSQCLPDEQSNEIAEDDLDLSMPLASLTTPVKSYVAPIENKSDDEPDDYLNTTLIPQVDGQHDSDDSDSENWVKKSVKRVAERKEVFEQFSTPSKPLGKSMPSLLDATTTDESPLLEKPLDKLDLIPYVKLPKVVPVIKIRPANIEKYIASYNQRLQKNESYRRSPEAARNDKIRLLKFRLDKFENRRKLHKVGKVIKRSASRLINVGSKPKFRVIPAIRHFLEPQMSKCCDSTLNRLARLTSNYIDPDLHLIIKTPLTAYFLHYGGRTLPNIVEIPPDLNEAERWFLCETFKSPTKSHSKSLLKAGKRLAQLQDEILNRKRKISNIFFEDKKIKLNDLVIRIENCNYAKQKPVDQQLLDLNRDFQQRICEGNCKLQHHLKFLKTCEVCSSKTVAIKRSYTKRKILSQDETSTFAQRNHFNFENIKREILQIEAHCQFKRRKITVSGSSDVFSDNWMREEGLGGEKSRISVGLLHQPRGFKKNRKYSSPFRITEKLIQSEVEMGHYAVVNFPFGNGEGIDESIQKRKATNSLLGNNIYINCDGANASSSDDEEQTSSKAKSLRKKMRSSPYPALAISVVNTPKPMAKSSIGNGENYVPMPGEHKHCHGAQQPVKVSHKRKLFPPQNLNTSTTTLSSTTTEEFLSCAYSSKPVAISYVKVQESSQSYDFPESDSDLFSDNDHNNLTVAEKYDLYSNFHAKEGCSTVITPHSSSLNSGHSSNIPPYQPDKSISSLKAPSRARVEATLCDYKIPKSRNQEPFYGNPGDYTGLVEIGQRTMRIASKTTIHLPNFDSKFNALEEYRKHFIENVAKLKWNTNNVKSMKLAHCANKSVILCPVKSAPSAKRVKEWLVNHAVSSASPEPPAEEYAKVCYSPLNDTSDFEFSLTPVTSSVENPLSSVIIEHKKRNSASNESCQIRGPTQNNTFGFDRSVQDLHAVRAVENHQYLTTMVMELHIRTRGELKPDPQLDEICAIFFSFLNDVPETSPKKCSSRGVIALNCLPVDLSSARADFLDGLGIDCDIIYVDTEQALIHSLVELVRKWDPDIFTGYEIEMLSWGYLIERAFVLSINLMSLLGRSELHKYGKSKLKHQEFETNIIGRVVINVWRIMRHEIALQSYTFESVVYHILHRRIPLHPFKELTFWWDHRSNIYRHRSVRYYLLRVDTVLELFHKLDFMNRTSELARLFGIMFYEVLSRGSQFRVESMMLRLAKPLNFVPVSPDTKQRAHMKAPEYIPLVMEPESKLYTDPVIVLDFQSLYPSMMIAYNYCFTTCLGRVGNLGTNQPFEFGANQLKVPRKLVEKLCKRELLNYSPCGVCFVKQKVREGILPRMLKEVLDTRLMVKNSMKENKGNANLQKVLHNRQLGLKLIANVTYGYTAANFSGRMCCVEVGDSVVSKGRETLQRAIALVENNKEWCAKVVYGDTDSLFVLVPNRSKEEAFEIGKQIADTVTADNPDPVKLKLEKVYQPCILQTKKRYVGYMYESPDDKVPVYEAKGIETVRRDGCPAVSKMLQKCLSLLFETKDVSIIKSYVLKQFSKILAGRASIQDLTFAKEYRGRNGYRPGACVPALELTRKWTSLDPRNEPRSGERVPYVIVNGPPGLPLIRLVRSPRDLLNDSSLRPNALYYITKVIIPPLNRCFNLIGADVNIWFNQMPRKNTQYLPNSSPTIKTTISQYFLSKLCASCSLPTPDGLCQKCTGKPHKTVLVLTEKLKKWEENYNNALLICQSCTGSVDQLNCASLDCPVLYRKTQTFNDLQQSAYVRELLDTSPIFAQTTYFDT